MRKASISLLLLLSILLVGCSPPARTALSIYERISREITIPSVEIYRYSPNAGHDTILISLYSGENEFPDAVSLCKDYLICLYKGSEIWELHIFITVSSYNNDRVKEMLVRRRDLLQDKSFESYLSAESLKRVSEASIIIKDDIVILALTDNNGVIETCI